MYQPKFFQYDAPEIIRFIMFVRKSIYLAEIKSPRDEQIKEAQIILTNMLEQFLKLVFSVGEIEESVLNNYIEHVNNIRSEPFFKLT